MAIFGNLPVILEGVIGSAIADDSGTISSVFGGNIPIGTRGFTIRADGDEVNITDKSLNVLNGSVRIPDGMTFNMAVTDEKSSAWGVVVNAGVGVARILAWR